MLSEPRASRHLKGNTVYRSRLPEYSQFVSSSTAPKIGSNIYEQLYRSHHLKIGDDTTQEDAQQIIKHLGYLYNTVGTVVRDVTKVLACKFNVHGRTHINNREKQNINSKNFIWGQEQAMISDDDDYVDNQHKQPTNFRSQEIPSYVQDNQIMVEQHKQHFMANSSIQHNEHQKQPQQLPQSSHINVGLPQYQQTTSLNIHTQTVNREIVSPKQKPFALSVPFVPQFSVYQLQYNNTSRQSVNPHINNNNNNAQQNNNQLRNAHQISQSQQHTNNKHRSNNRQIHRQKQAEINAQQNNQPKFVQVIQIDDDD